MVDAILGAGVNATTITGVQIRRTDAVAMVFDELAVPLPVVHALQPLLRVTPGVSVDWLGVQPVGSVLRAHQSVNLTDWSLHYRQFVGIDKPPFGPSQRIDGSELPARFYWFSQVTNPNATGISGFGGRTLTIEGPGVGTITYRFNAAGTGGTYENLPMPALLFSRVEGGTQRLPRRLLANAVVSAT